MEGGPSRVLVKNLVHIYEKKTQKQPQASATDHAARIQSKFNEVISSMTRIEDILSALHRQNKISDEEKTSVEQFQSVPLRAKEELLNLLMAKPLDAYELFLDALTETNQQHIVQILVSEIEIAQKEAAVHAGLIVRLYNWLSDNLNTDNSLVVALYRYDVLTKREREQLDSEKNRTRRNQMLLAIVSKKNKDEFQRFLSGLEEMNQVKVVNKFKGVDVVDGDSSLDQENNQASPLPTVPSTARVVPKPLSISPKPTPLSAKPQILSPKPNRSPSPAASRLIPQRQVTSSRRGSGMDDQPSPSPTDVQSPTRRSLPNIERQLSNPSSPVFHEISLKVATLRQSVSEADPEIKRTKYQESAQTANEQQKNIRTKDLTKPTTKTIDKSDERTKAVPRQSLLVGDESIKSNVAPTTRTSVSSASSVSKPSKVDELYDQLQSSLKEKEELRTQLASSKSDQKLLEIELQKLRNDQEGRSNESDAQIKKLRQQLEEKNIQASEVERYKEELSKTQLHLSKEVELNEKRERLLSESRSKLQELQDKNEELEKSSKLLQKESALVESQEILREKELKSEKEKLLDDLRERISNLEKQLEDKENHEMERTFSFKNQIEEIEKQNRDKISNLEKQVIDKERLAKENISELEKKLQDSEKNLDQITEMQNQKLLIISDKDKNISELQTSLISAQNKISNLSQQLEKNTNDMSNTSGGSIELNQLQIQLDKERGLGRERESLLVESLEKNAGLLKQLSLSGERLREEEKRSGSLEQVQMELTQERGLKERQKKDLLDLQEAFDKVNTRLQETEKHLIDKDKSDHELDKLTSELQEERQQRSLLELAIQKAHDKVSALQNEILAKDERLNDRSQETEAIEDLMSQLNDEKLLRIEVDKRLYDADEEISLLKQQIVDHEKLLIKANKEKDLLSQRLLEIGKQIRDIETLLLEANGERDLLRKQCEEHKSVLQEVNEEKQELIQCIRGLQNEQGMKQSIEHHLKETEQELHHLRQHSDNQKIMLQQAFDEKNVLTQKISDMENEAQRQYDLEKRLSRAYEEISLLRKQNDEQKMMLDKHNSSSNDLDSMLILFEKEQHLNHELKEKLKVAEEKMSRLVAQVLEHEEQSKEFKDQEIEINQLLQDINNEKRLRFEQQQKLDDARGTNAILSRRLEVAEEELRNKSDRSSTSQTDSEDTGLQLLAATQKIQELTKELKDKDTELWKAKKELAKERLQKKDVEKTLAAANEREQQMQRSFSVKEPRLFEREISSRQWHSRTADVTFEASRAQDPSIDDELYVANSGPPLNLITDRPKRKKSHLVKSSAGLLARETSLANGDYDQSSQPRPTVNDLRTNSMVYESII